MSTAAVVLLLTQCIIASAFLASRLWVTGARNAEYVAVTRAILQCQDAWLTVSDSDGSCPDNSRNTALRALNLIRKSPVVQAAENQGHLLGLANWTMGNREEATRLLNNAAQTASDPSLSGFFLGLSLLRQGSKSPAIDHLRSSGAAPFFISRARSQALQGKAIDAAADLALAKEIDPASIITNNDAYMDAWIRVGNLSRDQGDFASAEIAYSVAVTAASPGLAIRAYRELAVMLLQSGRIPESVEILQSATQLSPGDIDLRILLGDSYAQMGNDDKAMELYLLSASQATNPQLKARAYDSVGRLLSSRELWIDAIDAYREAVNYDPAIASYRIRLAEVYELAGQERAALQEYTTVLQITPNNRQIQQAVERLNRELQQR